MAPSHPPFRQLVVEAIEQGGSNSATLPGLKKHLEAQYGDLMRSNWHMHLNKALRSLTEDSTMKKNKGHFLLRASAKRKAAGKSARLAKKAEGEAAVAAPKKRVAAKRATVAGVKKAAATKRAPAKAAPKPRAKKPAAGAAAKTAIEAEAAAKPDTPPAASSGDENKQDEAVAAADDSASDFE